MSEPAETPRSNVDIRVGGQDVSVTNPVPVDLAVGDTINLLVADGADVAQGTTTDAAITSDTSGTVIGFLRGLVKWAFERMPASLGQKTKAASLPVTLASDEGTLTADSTPRASAAGNVHKPAADTAAVVTLVAAGASVSNILGMFDFSYNAAPTGGSITVEDGAGNTIHFAYVTAAGPGPVVFTPPLKGTADTAMIITLAAGGAAVSGAVTVHAWAE